ncbi:hypothetical protein [Paraburkholderia terrae]
MNLEAVVRCARDWWNRVGESIETSELYLFGSSIYRDGMQFDSNRSDLDLVTLIPDSARTAVDRFHWLVELAKHKQKLELELVPLLQRASAASSAVSLIPLTSDELAADVHKSKAKSFFAGNRFLNVRTGEEFPGLPGAGIAGDRPPLIAQALEYAQDLRCKYLSVPATGKTNALQWTSEDEPMPKSAMRCVAQIAAGNGRDAKEDERFDVNVGFSHFNAYVFQMRHVDAMYRSLYDWLIARSGGRGAREGLSSDMHLFVTEAIFDLAVSSDNTASKASKTLPGTSAQTRQEVISHAPLHVVFHINRSGHLAGDHDTLIAATTEATFNLKWRNQPYLNVRMAEKEVKDEIAACEQRGDASARVRRIALLDEQRWQAIKRSDLERGFQLLLFFQRVLFPNDLTRDQVLVLAMQSYALLCQERGLPKASSFGGPLVAENPNLEDTPGPESIYFGIEAETLKAYLRDTFQDDSLLHLGANPQSLRSFPEDMVAINFVPLLVKALLDSMPTVVDIPGKSEEYVEVACELKYWTVGVS